MKTTEMTEHDLDALLASARDAGPVPSADLMARVMADAVAVQPQAVAPRRPQAQRRVEPSLLGRLTALFGGGGALAGVSLAMVAGVFIGVVQPAPVAALTATLLVASDYGTVDLLPAGDGLWEE